MAALNIKIINLFYSWSSSL